MFQCRTRLCGWCSEENTMKKIINVNVSMPHAALWVVQLNNTSVAAAFLAVSMPHAALWVVQLSCEIVVELTTMFQCRTRLCGWCSLEGPVNGKLMPLFQCRTRLCGWCSAARQDDQREEANVSMPHAALWVVQLRRSQLLSP